MLKSPGSPLAPRMIPRKASADSSSARQLCLGGGRRAKTQISTEYSGRSFNSHSGKRRPSPQSPSQAARDCFLFVKLDAHCDDRKVDRMRKEPRRRTIHVPSDDTTILTIHQGQHPEAKSYDASNLPVGSEAEESSSAGAIRSARLLKGRQRRQSLAVAPKRVPLQPTLRAFQEEDSIQATLGSGPRKGILPPNTQTHVSKCPKALTSNAKSLPIFATMGHKALHMQELAIFENHSPRRCSHLSLLEL